MKSNTLESSDVPPCNQRTRGPIEPLENRGGIYQGHGSGRVKRVMSTTCGGRKRKARLSLREKKIFQSANQKKGGGGKSRNRPGPGSREGKESAVDSRALPAERPFSKQQKGLPRDLFGSLGQRKKAGSGKRRSPGKNFGGQPKLTFEQRERNKGTALLGSKEDVRIMLTKERPRNARRGEAH